MSCRKGKVRTFVEPNPKRRWLSKEMKEMLALQQELRKQDRFTRIRKDGKGGLYLEPVPLHPSGMRSTNLVRRGTYKINS